VLEYVSGSSLRSGLQRLAALGPVSGRLRAAIALQAARGESPICHHEHLSGSCGVSFVFSGPWKAFPERLQLACRPHTVSISDTGTLFLSGSNEWRISNQMAECAMHCQD
jgi:hypothetical protein